MLVLLHVFVVLTSDNKAFECENFVYEIGGNHVICVEPNAIQLACGGQ